jgi:hypothetical protein
VELDDLIDAPISQPKRKLDAPILRQACRCETAVRAQRHY